MSYPSQDQKWDAAQKRAAEVAQACRPVKPPPQRVQYSKTIPPEEFRWVRWVAAFVAVTFGILIFLVALSYAGPAMPR